MKKKAKRGAPGPSAASLRALPAIDFSRYEVRRNPYAARVQREGIEILHDGPAEASLAEIPSVEPDRVRVAKSPYAQRIAAEGLWIQVGRGRPRRGLEVGPTTARSIRLPDRVWKALEGSARSEHVTVHAVLRYAVAQYLDKLPRSGASEARPARKPPPRRR